MTQHKRKAFLAWLVVLTLLILTPGMLVAETLETTEARRMQDLKVSIIWVLREEPKSEEAKLKNEKDPVEEFTYDYKFVEIETEESFTLNLDPAKLKDLHDDPKILQFTDKQEVPIENLEENPAVYDIPELSAIGTKRDDLYFAESSAESANPLDGTYYYHRYRIMNQQINPKLELVVGEDVPTDAPLTLKLHMKSWAKDDQDAFVEFDVEKKLDAPKTGLMDLFELFGEEPDDVSGLRDFTAVELRWDAEKQAGINEFTLTAVTEEGYLAEVTGNDLDGFAVSFNKKP